jgi:hypothetical protein
MAHIAITEHREDTAVQWMEKVSDEQYNASAVSPQSVYADPIFGTAREKSAPLAAIFRPF